MAIFHCFELRLAQDKYFWVYLWMPGCLTPILTFDPCAGVKLGVKIHIYQTWSVFIVLSSNSQQIHFFELGFKLHFTFDPCAGVKLGVKNHKYQIWPVIILLSSNLPQISIFEFDFDQWECLTPTWSFDPQHGIKSWVKLLHFDHQYTFCISHQSSMMKHLQLNLSSTSSNQMVNLDFVKYETP